MTLGIIINKTEGSYHSLIGEDLDDLRERYSNWSIRAGEQPCDGILITLDGEEVRAYRRTVKDSKSSSSFDAWLIGSGPIEDLSAL